MSAAGSSGARNDADVVVVGAGSAGCVVAARLSDDPAVRVVLLEAGVDYGDVPPAAVSGPSFFDALAEPGITWPGLEVRRSSRQSPRVYARGRCVGGSSAINAMVAVPGRPGDYDRWADLGARGWAWADVEPWFERTSLVLNRAPESELGPLAVAFRSVRPDGTELVRLTRDPAGRRVSAADAYLDPVRDRGNLEIRGGSLVDRILFDGRRAVGVRLASGEELTAGRVVVAAGALHTPAILLRSGVDRPGVGRGLKDHAGVPVTLQYRPDRAPDPSSLAVGGVVWLSSGDAEHDLQILPLEHLGPGAPGLGMAMVALMQVHSEGTVTLAGDDPSADPLVEFRMLSDPRDLRRLRTGVEQLIELLDTPELRAVVEPILPDLSDEGLLAGLGDYVHASCTCRMGAADDAGAVVDPDGFVHGYEGLAVCDASVFPDLPRANTHLPTVMVAERLSARWKLLRQ